MAVFLEPSPVAHVLASSVRSCLKQPAFQSQANQSPQELSQLSIQGSATSFYPLFDPLNKQHTTYQKQQRTSHPAALERLLECYHVGIRAAVQKDVTKATEVLDLLERSLDAQR